MNPYEMTFIIRPDRDEDGTRAVAETVTGRISTAGGEVIATIPWNPPRRRMAYPIKDFGDGFYVTTVFRIDPTALGPIETALKLNDNILRFLIVQASDLNIKQAQQRLQQQQAAAAAPPAPIPSAPAGIAVQDPGAVSPDASDTDTASEEVPHTVSTADAAPVLPPTVEAEPIVGTEAADAASSTSVPSEAEDEPVESEPVAEPVTASAAPEAQE